MSLYPPYKEVSIISRNGVEEKSVWIDRLRGEEVIGTSYTYENREYWFL